MSIRSILAHADPDNRLGTVLDITFALATAHGAHPIGLHVSTDPAASLRTLPGPVPSELMAELEARVEAERVRAEAGFDDAAGRHGLGGEWRVESGDLIVMGAYGHSRTREWIFGGVTRSIMRTMTRPVLISH